MGDEYEVDYDQFDDAYMGIRRCPVEKIEEAQKDVGTLISEVCCNPEEYSLVEVVKEIKAKFLSAIAKEAEGGMPRINNPYRERNERYSKWPNWDEGGSLEGHLRCEERVHDEATTDERQACIGFLKALK